VRALRFRACTIGPKSSVLSCSSRYTVLKQNLRHEGLILLTDAEKIAEYGRLVELLKDRIKLEKFYRKKKSSDQTMQSVRVETYLDVVKLIIGANVLY